MLPPTLQTEAARLFELELWLLDHDARAPRNLLTRAGLSPVHSNQEPAAGTPALGTYAGPLPGGGELRLSAAGALCLPKQHSTFCVFFARVGFQPEVAPPPETGSLSPDTLGPRRVPAASWEHAATRRAAAALAWWMGNYEEWVGNLLGPTYRTALIRTWRKRPPAPLHRLPSDWRRLAQCFEEAAAER